MADRLKLPADLLADIVQALQNPPPRRFSEQMYRAAERHWCEVGKYDVERLERLQEKG